MQVLNEGAAIGDGSVKPGERSVHVACPHVDGSNMLSSHVFRASLDGEVGGDCARLVHVTQERRGLAKPALNSRSAASLRNYPQVGVPCAHRIALHDTCIANCDHGLE